MARFWCQISTPPSTASFFGGIQYARRVLKFEIPSACRLELAMFALLRSQNSKLRASRKKSSPAAGWNRRLGFVTLEKRMVLTAMEPFLVDSAILETISEPIAEIIPSVGLVDDASFPTDMGEPITTTDELPNDGSAPGDGIGGGGTIGDPIENQAPTVSGFDWSVNDGTYEFFGYVSDDVDPTGLYVYFGGLLDGAYAEVMPDGYFCFSISLEEPVGEVSVFFVDGGGLYSNQETISLY